MSSFNCLEAIEQQYGQARALYLLKNDSEISGYDKAGIGGGYDEELLLLL